MPDKRNIIIPEWIFFDFGETLFHATDPSPEVFISALFPYIISNPLNITVADAAKYYTELNREIAFVRNPLTEIMNIQFVKCLLDYLKIKLSLDEEETEYIIFKNAVSLIPENNIENLLNFLKQKKIKTAVISNYPLRGKTLEKRLREILPCYEFLFVMTSADYIFRKPSPVIFKTALQKCGTSPQKVMHCGDSFSADVCGARGAGITPVWYTDKEISDTLCVKDWQDFINYLSAIE